METTGFPVARYKCTLCYAGSCTPNPGYGGIGFIIYDDRDGSVVEEFSAYVNDCFRLSSNASHYKALIAGLQHALWLDITHITAVGHCKVLIQQVKSNWRVDKPWLKRYRSRVWKLASQFQSFKMRHVYSQNNSEARSLARAGFYSTFVDPKNNAKREILRRCRDPESAKKYVMEQRCDGYHKMKYILDTIKCRLPESYVAVRKLCIDISNKMGSCWIRKNNRVMASLLGLY